MKKIKSILYTGIMGLFALSACENQLEIEKLDFDVSVPKTTYKVGEIVTFNFNGNPDNIVFFSGETGNKYEFKDRIKAAGTPELQFTSFSEFGTQTNTLQLLASTTFSGNLDANIATGSWEDITNLVRLSTGTDNTPSGVVNLTQFLGDKPLYLAFRFVGQTGSTQKRWTIRNFLVQNRLTDGPVLTVANSSTAGFSQISLKNASAVWSIDASRIMIQGGPATSEENEDWVVTRELSLDKVAPDLGAALKNITTRMPSYPYTFRQAGTYKVTFIATNVTADKSARVIKELTITVTP